MRQNLGLTVVDTVLPAACHNIVPDGSGSFKFPDNATASACSTTSLSTSTVVPANIAPFINLYPIPNTVLSNNQYSTPAKSKQRVDFGQMRVDQNFSEVDSFFGRYTIDDSDLDNASQSTATPPSGTVTAFPTLFRITGTSRNQFLTLSDSHIFSSTLLNTARVSFSRTNFAAYNSYSQSYKNLNIPGFVEGPVLLRRPPQLAYERPVSPPEPQVQWVRS